MKKNIFIWSYQKTGYLFTLLLLAVSVTFFACNYGDNSKKPPSDGSVITNNGKAPFNDTSLLTIAAINSSTDGRNMVISFFEKEANYTVSKEDKIFTENWTILDEAFKNNLPVKIVSSPFATAITGIIKATDAEVRAYNFGDGFNSTERRIKGAANVTIDVSKIDTSKFNITDFQVRWFPGLKICTNIVPNYATLVDIFNYCASQGCNKPGPYSITNCIPFQFVKDGCYARAHKMRQMISKKYGYCCEKVFSYGPYPATLAVKADMWGGCCVNWWYHVVPLLRINYLYKGKQLQLCYVIDPGMFTKPVLLSTWLNAQKNTDCSSNANVTSYSIQPGSAYTPVSGGASYSTDPNLTATEQTLINYKNGVTCSQP